MAEDIQLLRQYAATRAQEPFAALVERHVALVYSAALRQLGGAVHRAEDVTQSVFIDLAHRAGQLSRRDDIVGWLYTSTRYAAANLRRAEARREFREKVAHTMHELPSDAPPPVDWDRLRLVLDDAMYALDHRDRRAILLRFFKNERFAELGRQLGMTEDAARMRVERALDRLRTLLAQRGVTSTASALAVALANQAAATAPAGLAASVTVAALAGATAVGVGTLASVICFMSASKVAVSLAAAGTLAVGVTLYQSAQVSAVARQLDDARGEHAVLARRVAGLQTSVKGEEEMQAAKSAALARAQAENSAAAAGAATRRLAADEAQKQQQKALEAFLGTDPELLKLRYDMRLAEVRVASVSWPAAARTPERIERQAREYAQRSEVRDAERAAGIEPKTTISDSARAAYDASRIVRDLRASVVGLDHPFSKEQVTQLTTLLTAARIPGPSQEIYARFDWDRVLASAEANLSPGQMQSVRGLAAAGKNAVMREHARQKAAAAVQSSPVNK